MHRKQRYFWEDSSKIPKGKPVPKRSAGLWNMRTFSITKIRQASIRLTKMSRLPCKVVLGQSFANLFKISLCNMQIAWLWVHNSVKLYTFKLRRQCSIVHEKQRLSVWRRMSKYVTQPASVRFCAYMPQTPRTAVKPWQRCSPGFSSLWGGLRAHLTLILRSAMRHLIWLPRYPWQNYQQCYCKFFSSRWELPFKV